MSRKAGRETAERMSVEQLAELARQHDPNAQIAVMEDIEELGDVQGPQPVKPFIASSEANVSVETPEAIAPPLSRYKVSLVSQGFPRLENDDIMASDERDAKRKFFERHGIVGTLKPPEISLWDERSKSFKLLGQE